VPSLLANAGRHNLTGGPKSVVQRSRRSAVLAAVPSRLPPHPGDDVLMGEVAFLDDDREAIVT